MIAAILTFALLFGAPSTHGEVARYEVSIGHRPVSAGTVSFHWYGWGSYKVLPLGEIRDGRLELRELTGPVFLESIFDGYDYERNPDGRELDLIFSALDGWFITLELPGSIYYRSEDVPIPEVHEWPPLDAAALSERFGRAVVGGISAGVESIAQSVTAEDSVTKLVLAEPKSRVITFVDLEAGPASAMLVHLYVFGTQNNHCAFHHGISIGSYTTNAVGEVELIVPESTPIFYGDVYYLPIGGSYAGVEQYRMHKGLLVGPDSRVEARWHFESRPMVVTVLDEPGGSPVEGVPLALCLRTWGEAHECVPMGICGATCGGGGISDADGRIRFQMWLGAMCVRGLEVNGETVSFEESELEELYRTGELTVTLKP